MGENETNGHVSVAVSSLKVGLFSSVAKKPKARSANSHRHNKRLGNKT